ncbi:hypothetical protein [Nocardiopsis synnemataformans]|uniref:hypothetical protein n=1 Tax=Nocardiopsis synnemataformans TaxID=61305 RepID=UPI003EB87E2D
MTSDNTVAVLNAMAERIGHDGRLPDDADATALVDTVLARHTPAGVYLTQGGRWELPSDHPAHRATHRPAWDWGMDAYPLEEISAPTPQDLRTCPGYWIQGPGHELASRTPCGHQDGYRLTNSCHACEDANEAPAGTDPDATTGPLVLSALAEAAEDTDFGLSARLSSEGDCYFIDLPGVWIQITDTMSERIDYPLSEHRGFCAQLVYRDDPSRYYLIYASADRNAQTDASHLARAVAAEAASRRPTRPVPPEAMDLMALNTLDWGPRTDISLVGLRSATVHVLDAAARNLGTTRAAAHAKLWPQALALAAQRPAPATDALPRLTDFTTCLAGQTIQDRGRVRRLVSGFSALGGGKRPTRAPRSLVRLLAGAVAWLEVLGEPRDLFAREGLPFGLEMLDALAQRGQQATQIDNGMGRAPEHILLYTSHGDISISTTDEHIGMLTAEAPDLVVEYNDERGCTTLHDGTGPVTSALIAEVADVVAQVVRGVRTP